MANGGDLRDLLGLILLGEGILEAPGDLHAREREEEAREGGIEAHHGARARAGAWDRTGCARAGAGDRTG